MGQMLAQFRWKLREVVYSDSPIAAGELKSFVAGMQPLMIAVLPELGGGVPYRLAQQFRDTTHEFQSARHSHAFKSCFDLQGTSHPPKVIYAIQPLKRFLTQADDELQNALSTALQGKPFFATLIQLGACVAAGIYPSVDGDIFFEVRTTDRLQIQHKTKKAERPLDKNGDPEDDAPLDSENDPEPPEFELHHCKIAAGEILPDSTWPETLRRLLRAISFSDLPFADCGHEGLSPHDRVERIEQLANKIKHHLREQAEAQADILDFPDFTPSKIYEVQSRFRPIVESPPRVSEQDDVDKATDSNWLHSATENPPADFYDRPLTGTKTELGFVIRNPKQGVPKDKALRDYLAQMAAAEPPKIWVRATFSKFYEAFFRDAKSLHDAEDRLKLFSERSSTDVGGPQG